MIKIRSTQKLATSNNDGLCDVQRVMQDFKFDMKKNVFTTIVQDILFQEQTVIVDEVEITERKIIETRQPKAYHYGVEEIDNFYNALGVSITKTKGFSTGLRENVLIVLLAQTAQYQRLTMTDWEVDNEENFVLVNEFTPIDES